LSLDNSRLHGIKVRALRFFSVWGPGQRLDLTHVSDVVRAIELAIGFQGSGFQASGFQAFNVGTGTNHSVTDMIEHASRKRARRRSFYTLLYTPADVHQTLADTRKSHILLRFQPLHSFQI
jgi:dTDP-L-rhamnose 4-epimerase